MPEADGIEIACPGCGCHFTLFVDTKPTPSVGGGGHSTGDSPLPKPELEVLARVAAGARDRDIAAALGLSVDAVKRLIRSALIRLNAQNRTEAAVRALAMGMLPVSRP